MYWTWYPVSNSGYKNAIIWYYSITISQKNGSWHCAIVCEYIMVLILIVTHSYVIFYLTKNLSNMFMLLILTSLCSNIISCMALFKLMREEKGWEWGDKFINNSQESINLHCNPLHIIIVFMDSQSMRSSLVLHIASHESWSSGFVFISLPKVHNILYVQYYAWYNT